MPAPKPIIMTLFQDNTVFRHTENQKTGKKAIVTVDDFQCKGLQTQALGILIFIK
jgi:hypothetical protein